MSFESPENQIPIALSLLGEKEILPGSGDPAHDHANITNKPDRFRQFVYLVQESMKESLVVDILKTEQVCRVIIYVRTNSAADQLAEKLNRSGITAESIHDNKSQRTKVRNFSNFKRDATDVLVATESALLPFNSIEVGAIINYDLPVSAETYVERVTRHRSHTGISAKVFSLCDKSESGSLSNINRVLNEDLEVIEHYFDPGK